jgi:hypothetical protein
LRNGDKIRYDAEIKRCKKIQKNNNKILQALITESKTRKLRVAFLVSENAKWSCQTLYEEFDRSDEFEPFVLVTADSQRSPNIYDHDKQLNETYNFFKSRKMSTFYAYDIKARRFLNLQQFNPDIVFYQQPWALDRIQSPMIVSKFALSCYVPYSIAGTTEAVVCYPKTFLYGIWKHFVVSESIKKEYESWMVENKESLVVTGHPKLDSYNESQGVDEHYIIYAPHFAFRNSILKLSTFDWNGKFILDFARAHRELKWVFKPHPRLKLQVIHDGIMTEDEIDDYYDEWAKIGIVYDQGDYFNIFKSSDALVTDCSSFLSEYLPTTKPVIHLISKDMVALNSISEVASSHYYKVHDLKELEFYLNDVIINKNDPMKKKRIDDIKILASDGISASSRILNYLKKEFKIHDK